MDEKALFLKIWDREAPAMRKVIARIPQDRSDYRADPKARTAREIALAAWCAKRSCSPTDWKKACSNGSTCRRRAAWRRFSPPTIAIMTSLTRRLHALPAAQWERRVPFMFRGQGNHERNRLRKRLGLSPGCDSPSRAAVHLPAPDGIDRAVHLRPERRRVVVVDASRRVRRAADRGDAAIGVSNGTSGFGGEGVY